MGNQEFEEHIRTRAVKPPAVLYKYARAKTARNVLSSGMLRFQSPLRYNDPFDSQWDILWPVRTPEAKEYERSIVEQAIRDPGSWPTDADAEFRRTMTLERARIAALPEEHREVAIAKLAQDAVANRGVSKPVSERNHDIRRRMRVLCLCENDRSILMWSHYAEEHGGVMLGFSAAVLENAPRCPLEAVKYCDGPPRLIDADAWSRSIVFGLPHPRLEGDPREWALAKHSDWAYEKEWRFVWIAKRGTVGDYEDFPFPRDALVEIAFGCRMNKTTAMGLMVRARALNPDVRFFQMSAHPSRFELVKTAMDAL